MRPATSAIAVVAASVISACGGDSDGAPARDDPGHPSGAACAAAAQCEAGLLCVSGICSAGLPPGSCAVPGNPTLVNGGVVGPASAPPPPTDPLCAVPVRPPAARLPAERVQRLGVHPVGSELRFELPPGTAGFSIVSQEAQGSAVEYVDLQGTLWPNTVQPDALLAPGLDGPFYTWESPVALVPYADLSERLAFHFGLDASAGALTVPNTSRALDLVRSQGGLPAGTWQFTIGDLARECLGIAGCAGGSTSGRYDVTVLTRPGPATATGTLDLAIYLASADPAQPGYTAAEATADPATSPTAARFRRFVGGLQAIFSRAGICLGTVTFHDLPPWARERYHDLDIGTSGPCSPLAELFSLSTGDAGAVHLFLVDTFLGAPTVVGIDGSIPGPSGFPGTVSSGAAVVLADFAAGTCGDRSDVGGCGVDRTAYVAAHEIGHWLGLYHTTEATGLFFDPLADTATCACATCAPPPQQAACSAGRTTLPASSCARGGECSGADNLMFWQIHPLHSQGAITEEQGLVMRLNPAVQ